VTKQGVPVPCFPEDNFIAWIFPLYFQLPYLPEGTCFQQAGSSMVEDTNQLVTISKR
jgi:hypothetical protein